MARRNVKTGMEVASGFGLNGLSRDQLDSIHYATLQVLQHTGLKVGHEEAVEIFHGSGASVERFDGYGVVRIPPYVVEDCIGWAPSTVVYHGRSPDDDFVVEPRRVSLTTGGGCVNVIDLMTRERRGALKKDCGEIARVSDALDEIGVFNRPCIASDVPPEVYPVHVFEIILANTSKHVLIGADTARNLKKMVELAAACVGGPARFKRRPIFTANVCPTSPLSLLQDCCEVVIEAARQGVGLGIIPMALAGATSTATLAGTLVTTNAEALGALMLAQLTARGTPCTYENTSTIMDLSTGIGAVGAPELSLVAAGTAQLAQYYRLPCLVGGAMSDSKIPDAQAAYETALSTLTAALAGANIIFGAGALDQLLTFDFAKLVMDVEFMGMVARVTRGIEVSDESMALDVIDQVGPGGEFMTHDHTYDHMGEISKSRLFDRNTREVWLAAGGRDLTEQAYEKAMSILKKHQPRDLPKGAAEAMHSIVEEYEREIVLSRK
ncbi:MAG: trimethylamine methyltransferase family protein [Deltaproteobacteria bacterium]|nr:trimethylamine methyltransferase family protein [Deltaproteobacteria bacterium]